MLHFKRPKIAEAVSFVYLSEFCLSGCLTKLSRFQQIDSVGTCAKPAVYQV